MPFQYFTENTKGTTAIIDDMATAKSI